MASFEKVKAGYKVGLKIKVGDDSVRESKTFRTKAEGAAWAYEREKELRGQAGSGVSPGKTLSDAFIRYEKEVSRTKRGHRWEALRLSAMSTIEVLGKPFGAYLLAKLTPENVGAYRDVRLLKVQGATVNREFNLLSNVLSVARDEWRWMAESPTKKVRRPKDNPPRTRRPSDAEIERISFHCNFNDEPVAEKKQALAVAFLFAIETAMREGEIAKLIPAFISGPVANLPASICKNGHARSVPLTNRALELLSFLPAPETAESPYFMMTADAISVGFRKVTAACAIEDLHFHDARREAASRWAKKIDVMALARMTGHRDINELMTYYNEAPEDVAAKLSAA